MTAPDQTEARLSEAIQALYRQKIPDPVFASSSARQTFEIKDALDKLGQALGYQSRYSLQGENHEFLLDLIWVKTKDIAVEPRDNEYFQPRNCIQELVLGLEVEWIRRLDEVLYDFQKLILCRSKYRILLFWDFDDLRLSGDVVPAARELVEAFSKSQPGDRYPVGAHGGHVPGQYWHFTHFSVA